MDIRTCLSYILNISSALLFAGLAAGQPSAPIFQVYEAGNPNGFSFTNNTTVNVYVTSPGKRAE